MVEPTAWRSAEFFMWFGTQIRIIRPRTMCHCRCRTEPWRSPVFFGNFHRGTSAAFSASGGESHPVSRMMELMPRIYSINSKRLLGLHVYAIFRSWKDRGCRHIQNIFNSHTWNLCSLYQLRHNLGPARLPRLPTVVGRTLPSTVY